VLAEPLNRDRIADAARELLEAEGPDALTMRRLAEKLGVRAPSLYKHFPDKRALEYALIEIGFAEFAAAFEGDRTRGEARLASVGRLYRAYALAHPHLYRLMTEHPLDRSRIRAGVEERAANVVIDGFDGDEHTARALWAFMHGMVVLELNGRFPARADLDRAWDRGLAAFRSLA
jgi:AcrR family transcriptional regulator